MRSLPGGPGVLAQASVSREAAASPRANMA